MNHAVLEGPYNLVVCITVVYSVHYPHGTSAKTETKKQINTPAKSPHNLKHKTHDDNTLDC